MPSYTYTQARSLARLRRVWAVVTAQPCASVRELATAANLSMCATAAHVRALIAAGYIEVDHAKHGRARRVVIPFVCIERGQHE